MAALSQEQKRLESTCASVLQGMAGKMAYVELRGESYAFGILESCDSQLNIRLKNATILRNSQKTEEPEYFVIGKHVRFVHFENHVHSEAAFRRCQKGVTANSKKNQPNRRLDQKQFDSGRQTVDRLETI